MDPGEHPQTSALRECEEETGIIAKNPKLIGITSAVYKKNGIDKQSVYAVYLSTDFSGEVKLSSEHTDWKWVPLSEVDESQLCLNCRGILKNL